MSGNKIGPEQRTKSECKEVDNFENLNNICIENALSRNAVKPQQGAESETKKLTESLDINASLTTNAVPGHQKMKGYQSTENTNRQNTCVGEGMAPPDSERTIQAKYRVVVVGRTGCGKSTICNALLNVEVDKFRAEKGPGSSTGVFQSEINEEKELEVVDTPDVFNMGCSSDEEARNKFRGDSIWTLSGIPTAFLFPIRMDERFTPIHFDLCNKYLQLLAKPYKNTILVLSGTERAVKDIEQTSLPELIGMFDDRVIRLPQVLSEGEDKEQLITEVIEHLSTMEPISLKPERNVCSCVFVTIIRVLNVLWQALRWLFRVIAHCSCCQQCPDCKCCKCCWYSRNDIKRLNP